MIDIKVYKGQALAIVMIVLVISAILGVAMLSRTLKDTRQIGNEKSSAEALEFADSMIDSLKGTPVSLIDDVCKDPLYSTDGLGIKAPGGCSVKGLESVRSFMGSLNVPSEALNIFDKCQGGNSQVEITAKLASGTDPFELPADRVRSVVARGQTPAAGCAMNFTFEPRGASFANIMVSRIYANLTNGVPSQYKSYSYGDIQQYCVYLTGQNCTDNSNADGSWIPLESGATLTVPLTAVGGFALDEIRVRTFGGAVSMTTSISSPSCLQDWEMVKVSAGANCTGAYRATEVQIPQQESASSLFDYVIFNGNGILGPE